MSQQDRDLSVGLFPDPDNFFLMTECDADVCHVPLQGVDNLSVDKFKQARSLVDQHDLHAYHGQDRCVLCADHAAADNDYRGRKAFERDETVGIDDRVIIEWNISRSGRHGPYCDDDHAGIMLGRHAALLNEEPVRINEAGFSMDQVDAVTRHLVLHNLNFVLDDVVGAKREIFDRDRLFQTIAGSVQVALAEPREIEDRLAEGFAGDGAGVGGDTADGCFALDDADGFAELGGLDRCFLAGGPTSYDKEIVLGHRFLAKKG